MLLTLPTSAAANSPPEISVPGDKTYEQGQTITAIDFKVTDLDGDEVTTTVSGLPSGLSYTNSLLQGTVSASATAQDYTVSVSANDGVNAAVTGTFTITVTVPNSAPEITIPGNQTYEQGETITAIDFKVTDLDGDEVTTTVSGLPSGLSYTNSLVQGTVSVSATAQDYTVTVSASDGVNATVTGSFTITVTEPATTPPANSPPQISVPGNKTYEQGQTITAIDFKVTDEDGDEVTTTVSGLPSGLSYTNSLVQGTVSVSATAQDYTVSVSANDGVNAAVTGSFTITVTEPATTPPANSPPQISVPGDKTYEQGETITAIDFKVTDVDGDEVTTTVSGLPSGLSYTNSLVQGTVSVSATAQDYTVTVSADDGVNAAVTGSFTITVTVPNSAPEIIVPGDKTYEQGQTITAIDFKVTDVDGDEVTTTVSGLPSGLSYTNSRVQGTVSVSATAQDYTVTVSANDGVNAAVTGSFTITVTEPATTPPANSPPQISVPGDKTYEQGQTITAIDFKVTDEDGDEVTTTVSGLPSGLSYTNSLVQGTVSASAAAQDYTVTVSADDGVNAAVTGTFTITVTVPNSAPEITVPGDKTYEQGQTITAIDFKVTDVDGDEVTTTVSGLPSGLSYTNSLLQGTVSASATAQDYTVTVSANDGVNAAVTGSFTITVTEPATTPPANSPPQISVPGDKTYEQGQTITAIDFKVTDEDGDEVTTTVSGLPSGLSYTNSRVQGTVSVSATAQDYTVTVSANDGVNAAVTGSFTITVTEPATTPPANSPPQISVPGDKTYEQGETITAIDFKVTDEDGDEVTTTVSGLPSGLSYTNSLLQGTVSASATAQDYTVTVSANDGVNAAVTGSFTITVTVPNSAPEITVPGNQTYEQGQTITAIDFKVTDEDGDEVTTTVSGLPSGLAYTNSLVQGTVSASATAQDYTVTVSANDGVNAAVTGSFTITVTEPATTPPANSPPQISVPGDKTYEQGQTITAIDFKVTDEDGDEVTTTVSGLPSGLSYTNSLVQGTVSASAAAQDYTVTVSADDGVNAAVTGTFTITVTVPNSAPEITVPGDKTYEQGQTITAIDFKVTDVDGDEVTTTVSGLPSGLSYTNSLLQGTVSASATAQDYTVTVSANDGVNAAVTGSFTITVTEPATTPPANSPPQISVPGDKTYERGETIKAFWPTVSDADGDPVRLTMSGLPSGLSYTSGIVQGTVSASAAAQDYTVTVSADDGVNAAVTGSFTITVTASASTPPANRPPVITVPGDKTYEQGETITAIDFKVTDEDGDEVTTTVSGLPSGLAYTNSLVQGTVSSSATAQDYTVAVSANDGVNAAVTGSFTITVTASASTPPANRPPVITVPGDKTYEQGETITAIDFKVTDEDGDEVTTTVSGLPSGLSYTNSLVQGTVSAGATAQDYTVTVSANDGVNAAVTGSFTITVTEPATTPPANSPPEISVPGNKTYEQGETIAAIDFKVTDVDGDEVTTTVSGLPSGLSYTNSLLQGTVSADAAAQDYTVTVSASDGVNAAVTGFFTITVTEPVTTAPPNSPPEITVPGDKTYEQGETITAIDFKVTDVDGDEVTTTVSGLASGLSYTDALLQGTVSADATAQDYTVTVSASDGVNAAVTASFVITVTAAAGTPPANRLPEITLPGDKTYEQGETITAIDFKVTDVDGDEVTLTVSGLPSGLSYTDALLQGTISADATAQDYTVTVSASDGVNAAVTGTFTITVTEAVAVTIAGPADAQNGAFDVRITFSESVNGFLQGDVTVGNGSVTALTGSGGSYTATITPAATGTVTVDVPADVAAGAAGNGNEAAVQFSVRADLEAPSVGIAGPSDAQNGPFDATISFSEDITGFEQGDVTVGNGSVTAFSGSGNRYTATITPAATGAVTADVAARVARDAAGNGNTAATRFSVQVDVDRPSVSITGPAATQTGAFNVSITFSESVVQFGQGDVKVGKGTVSAFSGSGDSYGATITPAATGLVTVDVAANAARDAVGSGNTAADQFTVTVSLDASKPVLQIIKPGDKTYAQGETITSFGIPVINTGVGESPGGAKRAFGNADPVTPFEDNLPTVTVGGLPSGLSYTSRKVGGTVSADATVQTYTVDIKAANVNGQLDDTTFRITVTASSEVTVSDATAAEGEALSFMVKLGNAVPGGLTVTPVFAAGTASVDEDYTPDTTPLSFTGKAGEEQTFTVQTIEDEVVEAAETFAVSLAVSGTTAKVTGTGTATGTITDDDAGGVSAPTLTLSDATAIEGEALSFTVRLARAVQGGLTVTPLFGDVTATAGVDYTENTSSLSFIGAADEARTFTVSTIEDEAEEEDETFTLSLAVSDAPSGVSAGNATGTITDDDGSRIAPGNYDGGTVYVSVHEPEDPVEEGLIVELPVRITESVEGTVRVPWYTLGAALGSKLSVAESESKHEHEPSSGTATLAAGQTETTIEIIILDDEEHEDLERFQIALGKPTVASEVTRKVSVSQRTATVTILDNDAPPVFDEGDTATRSVVENTPPGTAIGGPFLATDAEDDPLSYTLAGADAPVFTLDPATGQLRTREPLDFETRNSYDGLTVTVDDGHSHTDVLSLTVHVTDTSPPDAPRAPTVVRSSTDPESSLDVIWNPPADNGAPVTDYDVRYREAGTTAWREHAFEGAGVGATLTTLKWASTFEVQVRAKNAEGAGEWSDSGRGSTLDPSVPRETVTTLSAGATEGAALTFAVTLNRAVQGGLTVTPRFSDGTATRGTGYTAKVSPRFNDRTATRGTDYTANATGMRFEGTKGERHTFDVTTIQDEIVEYNEKFTVRLDISGTSASGLTAGAATGTITDDDTGTVSTGSRKASEGDGLTFRVTLNQAVQGGLTVTPVFKDGTATAGIDYTANTAPLTFAGTAREAHTFTVATKEDEAVEENETFTVSLRVSDAPSGVTVGNPVTGTIIDDDGGTVGGNPTVASKDANAPEGDGMTFRVTLNRAVQGGLTLTPVFSDGTATSGIDYTADTAPLTFTGVAGEAHTFTVATTEDDAVEENETFTVSLQVSDAPSGVTAGKPVTGTIIDDDGRNESPDFDDAGHATTRAVAENTPAGGPVGEPVSATDANGDTLSYTLSGSDAFAIDTETGQITVSEGASLDYEAGPLSYAVTVTVNDGRDGNDIIEVAISITDVAEPPAAPGAPRVTGASLSSVQVHWRAPENTGPAVSDYDVQYRKQDAANWTYHAFTGTKNTSEIQGLEPGANYEVQVRAKNAEGAGAWSEPGSGRTRVNTAPVAVDDVVTVFRGRRATSLSTGDTRDVTRNPSATPPEDFDIPEPEAGAKIAPLANSSSATETDDGHISVLANDVDAEDDWSLLTAILVEAPLHGTLKLYENGTFVYTHDGSRAAEDRFTYRVMDSRGAGSDEATVTILITGVNLGPSVTGTIPDQVLTMGANGRVDLTGLFTDPDGDPLAYEASSDNGIIKLSLVDGVITLTPVAVSTARVTVTARDPYGLSAKLSFAVAVENAQTNRARTLELSLAALGRTVVSQAVDAIAGRFESTSRALRATLDGGRLVLGQAFNAMEWVHVAARLFGIPLDAHASRSAIATAAPAGLPGVTSDPDAARPTLKAPSGRSILTRSSFRMAMDRTGSAENGWTLWGRGAGSRYAGDAQSDNRMDGRVTAAYVGADYHWSSKLTLGVAASYSDGLQDFDNAGESTGKWQTRLASLRPYLHWSPTGKLGLWGMLGFGRGDAELNSGYGGPLVGTGSSTVETDISSRSAALGGRMDLTRVGNVDLALTADAFAVTTVSEAVAGLRATTGDARRVRMMVNGSTGWLVTPDSRMDLSLALGARVDGGDVEAGLGAELSGALSLSNRRIGLDVEVRSHWLAAHRDRDFREGGLSLALRLDPGADRKGLNLALTPAWGENAARGVESLWNGERMMAYRNESNGQEGLDWRPKRTRATLGYGLDPWGGRGRLEPFVELDVEDLGLHRFGGGLRVNVPGASNGSAGALTRDLQLELLGEFRPPGHNFGSTASRAGVGTPDYRVGLTLFRNF